MHRLTPSERSLLFILLLTLFGGANFFGYKWLSQRETKLRLDSAQMKADQAEAEVSLRSLPAWKEREAWIVKNEPVASNEGDAKAETLQFVLNGARDSGLQVTEQSFKDTDDESNSLRVGVALTVKGSMEALAEWLAKLQDPKSFYAVPTFSLKADEDRKSMVCSLQIYRYFRKPQS